MVPVELLGYVPFPRITAQPYALSLAPYSFLWLELQPAPAPADPPTMSSGESTLDLVTTASGNIWSDLLAGPGQSLLHELLPPYLARQRWFGAKSRTISSIRIADWFEVPQTLAAVTPVSAKEKSVIPSGVVREANNGVEGPAVGKKNKSVILSEATAGSGVEGPAFAPAAIVFLSITYADAQPDTPPETYQLPLALTTGPDAETIRADAPHSILASLTTAEGPAILHDATAREDFRQTLLSLIEERGTLYAQSPTCKDSPENELPSLSGIPSPGLAEARGPNPLPARTSSAEQSNTSILYDQKLILKLFRRLQPGENPDVEIGRFLTEVAHFPRIAPFLGEIRGRNNNGEQTTLAMLQGLVENEGDGWEFTLDELARYYESVSTLALPPDTGAPPSFLTELPSSGEPSSAIPAEAREHAGLSLDAAALLGRRTAELHLALATPTDNPAFTPEPFTPDALAADVTRIRAQITGALDALKRAFNTLPDELTTDSAALILSRRAQLFARAHAIAEIPPAEAGMRIRIHGDYHLGQLLRSRNDYVILDFEGEPARPLAQRRAKQSPLKDVAGMVRSFSYAAYSALDRFAQRNPSAARSLEPWAQLWQNAASTAFLDAWRATMAAAEPTPARNPSAAHLTPQPLQAQRLLNAYLLEKALYELLYELNNRPAWVRIPLAGILSLRE